MLLLPSVLERPCDPSRVLQGQALAHQDASCFCLLLTGRPCLRVRQAQGLCKHLGHQYHANYGAALRAEANRAAAPGHTKA